MAYRGWSAVRVTRGIESLAGSFAVNVAERWPGRADAWPIREEDACAVRLGDETLITGYVDQVELALSGTDRGVTVGGKDAAAALVECSASLGTWQLTGQTLLQVAERLASPYGVGVSVQPGLVLGRISVVALDPGDSAWEALEKVCRLAGCLAVSDGRGGILLTRSGSAAAGTALVEGENILAASSRFSAADRFRTYSVTGQTAGSDDAFGLESCAVLGSAEDGTVRRTERLLMVRADSALTRAGARTRAQWEATVRAARAVTAEVTVSGWTQEDGALWPINALVDIRSPRLRLDGRMLISAATYALDSSSGTTTTLTLTRPDAFRPEPVVPPEAKGFWRELVDEGRELFGKAKAALK